MTRTVGTMEKFFMIDVSDPYVRLAAVVIDNAMKTVEKGSLLHHWKKRSQQRDRKCARDWLERCLPHYLDALTHDDTLYHYYLTTAQQLVRSYDRTTDEKKARPRRPDSPTSTQTSPIGAV